MWSSYRKCTVCAGFCHVFSGAVLVVLWTACYYRCLSRLDARNDLAAPVWLGVVSILVGSFGLLASCQCWKRKYETLLYVLTLIAALCSAAGIVLSVHAAFREYLRHEEQGRPPEAPGGDDGGVLGVALFGVMAAFSFALFLTGVTWSCACFFKRYKGKGRDEEDYDLDDVETMIWEYEKAMGLGQARRSSPTTGTRPSGPRRHVSSPDSNLSRQSETSRAPGHSAGRPVRAGSAAPPGRPEPRRADPDDGTGAAPRPPGRRDSVGPGPRFSSVTAAELRWWEYYTPPKEKAGFGGF